MNPDLKLRLTPLYQASRQELDFLVQIREELTVIAMWGPLRRVSPFDIRVNYHFEYIENGEDDSAYMTGNGETFDIHIDKRMPIGMILDFIVHELAHVHSWYTGDEYEDHCDEFGKSYALLYRGYLRLYDKFWGII